VLAENRPQGAMQKVSGGVWLRAISSRRSSSTWAVDILALAQCALHDAPLMDDHLRNGAHRIGYLHAQPIGGDLAAVAHLPARFAVEWRGG
jgi:hypothetical protein